MVALIEAKKLETPLARIKVEQVIKYARDKALTSLKYVVWTNGDHWQIWSMEEDREESFQLSNTQEYECAAKVIQLLRSALEVQEMSSTPKPSRVHETIDPSNNGDWEPLTSLKVERGQKLPTNTNIKFPDSSTKPLKHWTDMLAFVAEYLVKTGKISAQNCPVIKGNSKLYLLHTEPIHRDLKEFMAKREIGNGLWLLTYFSADKMHENACWLLDKFGVNPSTVLISTNQS